MNRKTLTAVLCLGALSLAACEDADSMKANGRLCADWKAKTPAATPASLADPAAPVDECVRRWAYSLASADDDAETVSAAVVAACSGALSRWNQQGLTQPNAGEEAISITTGQPTNPLAEHSAYANGRALFYVVQARAGHCTPPPVKDGVPEGLPAAA